MTDENGNLSREYKNREGQIVCKDEAANNTTITTRTYYVYDDMGKLRYVIQPKAEAYLKTKVANNLINLAPNGDASIRDLVFTYFYDPNGLLIEKRMPGETAINQYVYNIRDQLVLTWDAKGTKIYTKFDNLNRPVSSGFYTGTELVNTLRTNAAANNTWPTATITEFQRNYYDNLITTNYPAANQVAFSTNGYATSHATNLQGRLVGTVNSIFSLTGGTGLLTAPTSANEIRRITILNTIYYDSKGRIVQSGTKNHKDGFEYTHNKYDFVDRITATKQTTEYKHWTSLTASTTQSKTIELKTTYDEASRVQSVCQKIDADPWQPVTRNYYNDLGELNEKVQGCYVQRNNYKYNIRGWLTDINDLATFTTQATGSNPDLFAMHLDYNATGQYLGNITGQQWRTLKKRNDTPTAQEAFTYTYDNLNRTLAANYTGGRGGLSTEVYGTNPYDKNGNILKLKRSQLVGTTNTLVDDITYTYAANSNRLINTTDVSSKTAFYAEATVMPAVDEYSYDLAGNLTRDRNKVILTTSNINQGLAITYNGINLPSQMITTNNSTATNNGRINNYYLPNGQKIRTEYTNSTGAVQRSYDYLGGSIWVGGAVSTPATLDFIGTAEGRAILTARVYTNENNTTVAPPVGSPIHRYEYDLKDHLGNQRVACRCGDPKRATTTPFAIITGVGAGVEPTMMVQETHYDAWGVSFNQTTETQIPSGQTDRYLYNGKERIKELNVNWMDYGARYYDPMIGRWNGVDPMAEVVEENNPYNYCLNNPILLIDLDGLTADTSGTQKTIVLNDIVVTAKKLPPIEGFWQHVDYYWNGRSVDGIDYDKNGIPTGISPITGGPDLIGGVATGAFTVYKGIKLGLPYIGKSFNILKRYTKSERLTLQIESVIKGVPDKKLLRAIEQKILEYKKASGEVANKYNAFDPKRKDYPEYMEKASNWLEQNVPNWTKLFD
ncbi:RHS repeat domain-containing protein [Lacihabitans sp. CS3-21]|uniref:RHS repeat domain-containing protein n=1 Tax=Lacihabitans sp. CS3-21 TaxID=2487332 RepID=UPI0038F677E9